MHCTKFIIACSACSCFCCETMNQLSLQFLRTNSRSQRTQGQSYHFKDCPWNSRTVGTYVKERRRLEILKNHIAIAEDYISYESNNVVSKNVVIEMKLYISFFQTIAN